VEQGVERCDGLGRERLAHVGPGELRLDAEARDQVGRLGGVRECAVADLLAQRLRQHQAHDDHRQQRENGEAPEQAESGYANGCELAPHTRAIGRRQPVLSPRRANLPRYAAAGCGSAGDNATEMPPRQRRARLRSRSRSARYGQKSTWIVWRGDPT
jgi:hypothetical protein